MKSFFTGKIHPTLYSAGIRII